MFRTDHLLLLIVAFSLPLAACQQRSPMEDDQPRTPFTQYNELRQKDPELNVDTPTGDTYPNLRVRVLQQR